MAFYLWNWQDYFRKLPSAKLITRLGKRKWDRESQSENTAATTVKSNKTIFSMPSFARHGRWGNMVFQYIFIRVLALYNNGEIELNREGNKVNSRLNLYLDTQNIPDIQTGSSTIVIDNYRIFPMFLNFIPHFFWRAMYVTQVRLQKCLILNCINEVINNKNLLSDQSAVEVEGLFMIPPRFYKDQHKDYISSNLLRPHADFRNEIEACMQALGTEKTIIGIHMRRGDYVQDPLGNFGQFPIPVKYITKWLDEKIGLIKNPVIYVCSDDQEAYKDIEKAGFEVLTTKKLLPEGGQFTEFEQLDWEILRRCDILITSNSSFSFTSALLSEKHPECYQFSLLQKAYTPFDPWVSEPLQSSFSAHYLWSYLYSRFTMVSHMVSIKAAFKRLLKDLSHMLFLMVFKVFYLRHAYGFSKKFFAELVKIFQLYSKTPFSDDRYETLLGYKNFERSVPGRDKSTNSL